MTKKTRYFVVTAGAVLVVGLGGGLIAYLAYNRAGGVPAGLPSEMRYVPADAEVIAFANVRVVMDSELRRSLMTNIDPESRKGKQMMNDFAGVDLEKQVDHVVMFVEPVIEKQGSAQPGDIPRASVLVNGSFDQARIEQAIRERGGSIHEHNGRKLFIHDMGNEQVAVGFVEQDLIAIGDADLVRRAIDISRGTAREFQNVTTNDEVMNLLRDNAGSTAWVTGQFEEISRRMKLPTSISGQVPAVRLVSAKADVNGGVKATIRAEASDKAAADQLRDVVRGFLSLARLHAGAKEELSTVFKTVELSGTDNTVRLSFALSPETLRVIAPSPRRGGNRGRGFAEPMNPTNPANPPIPPSPVPSTPSPRP
jgi:hypothetical protein